MASDATQLVVRLEARLNQFEQQLKKAGDLADTQATDIEGRFAKINPAASGIGIALGAGIATGAAAAIKLIEDLYDRFKRIQESSELTGVSLRDAFAVEKILGDGGLKGLDKVATLLDRTQRGEENYLSKLFDANGVKNIKEAGEAYDKVVDIIQRAPKPIRAREIGAGLGIDAGTVSRMRDLTGEFGKLRSEAADAAPDVEKLAQLAKDFDAAWEKALKAVKAYVVETVHDMAVPVAEFVETTLAELRTLLQALGGVGDFFGRDTSGIKTWTDSLTEGGKALRKFIDERAPMEITVNKGPPSKPPPLDKSKGSGSSGPDPDRFFDAQLRRTKDSAEDIELETRLLGANTEERIKAKAALDLQQAARRGEITLTGEQMRALEAESAALGRATASYELARQKQAQGLALQNFAGNTLVDALDKAVLQGGKLSDIMENVAQSIARAALQAVVLGQGPLAGLFGTSAAPGSGNVGGLIGALAGLVKGAGANAGGTDNWRGGLSWVGERGPELLNLPRGAQVIPNDVLRGGGGGGLSVSSVVHNYAGAEIETRQSRSAGGLTIETVVRAAEDLQAQRMARGQGSIARVTGGNAAAYRRG